MKKIIITQNIMHAINGGSTFFGRSNVKAYPARTAEEILNIHAVHNADIIIAEANLPVMGGAKLCSEIRSDEGLKSVSIIMVCDGTEASLTEWQQARVNAVIPQPIDPVLLFSKISELLIVPQRQDIRALLHVSVSGQEGNSSFLGISENISISGMLLETDQTLKKGDRMNFTIEIGGRKIAAECQVKRVDKAATGKFRYGVKFAILDTKSLIIIDQFVRGGIKH
jgi:DNA-binding response OmpR family regulator